ncbi:bifunctional DNA primase/polymerase [Acinetobacter sp. YH12211]|uniref:bifunctional DNA primase/polymerase n=1 Tax=Acinetobacter sp. YH12211 TaxID=2601147 RepID=UPI0015D1CEE6|nr:bifunctional DNA primase/polymerase [Acinetobacter sp. YH12211]
MNMQIDPTAGTGDMPALYYAAMNYVQNGWKITQLPKRGKRPILNNWRNKPIESISQVESVWGNNPEFNIGLLCSNNGLVCVDVDLLKPEDPPEMLDGFQELAILENHYGFKCVSTVAQVSGSGGKHFFFKAPAGVEFVGNPTNPETGKPCKKIDIRFNHQIVVEPSIHPDTGKQYQWIDGGILANEASDLPPQLLEIIRKDRQRQTTGQPKKATPVAESEQSDLARVREALSHIPPDCAYDEWVKIGAGIYSEFGENGFSLWDEWSSRGSKYNPAEMRGKYSSFAKITQVRIPTVYHVAMQSGWKPKATAEWIQAQTLKHFEVIDPATGNAREASKAAVKICDTFAAKLKETLKLDPAVTLDDIKVTYKMNPLIVDRFINETIRDKNSSEKLHLLTRSENLNSHLKKDAWTHLVATYGQPYDAETLEKDMNAFIEEQTAGMKKGDAEDFAKSVRQVIFTLRNAVYWHIDHYNQRTQLSFSVDMFAQVREVELLEDKAHFTLTHRNIMPMKNTAYMDYDHAVIEDYKKHFPEFESVLRFLVMSRFAPDRKKSYLWLHVVSDWGKGFFKAILENLRLCVELSVKEVEGMFEGKPSGQHPDNFRRAFAVIFDEFKTVKSEIKQLERRISLAPKFELRSEVELFAKLFFSAENVHSLIGASGIEDQMANRFNCIRGANQKLEDRELFKKIGSSEYLRHLTGFAAEYLNKGVKRMQDLGRVKAEKHASEWLGKFHEKYGIDKLGKRLSHILPEIAEEFREYLYQQWNFCGGNFSHDYLFTDAKGNLCLKKPQKVISDWLKEQCDPSELATMMHKRDELLKLVAQDGNVTTRAIKNPHTKENARAITIR